MSSDKCPTGADKLLPGLHQHHAEFFQMSQVRESAKNRGISGTKKNKLDICSAMKTSKRIFLVGGVIVGNEVKLTK
jgi:hypothetical protein